MLLLYICVGLCMGRQVTWTRTPLIFSGTHSAECQRSSHKPAWGNTLILWSHDHVQGFSLLHGRAGTSLPPSFPKAEDYYIWNCVITILCTAELEPTYTTVTTCCLTSTCTACVECPTIKCMLAASHSLPVITTSQNPYTSWRQSTHYIVGLGKWQLKVHNYTSIPWSDGHQSWTLLHILNAWVASLFCILLDPRPQQHNNILTWRLQHTCSGSHWIATKFPSSNLTNCIELYHCIQLTDLYTPGQTDITNSQFSTVPTNHTQHKLSCRSKLLQGIHKTQHPLYTV